MSSSTNLSKILAMLPGLSGAELDVVSATCGQLARMKATTPRQRKPKQKDSAKATSGKAAKQKGPAVQVSQYAGEPAYEAFKAAEKALKVALKSHKLSLREVEAVLSGESESKLDSQALGDLEPVVKTFRTAQSEWFRQKGSLSGDGREITATEEETASQPSKKEASPGTSTGLVPST